MASRRLPSGAHSITTASGRTPDGSIEIVTGGGGGDTTAPVWPGGAAITLVGGTVTTTGFQLNWTSATDNVAVTAHRISTDGGATYPITWGPANYTFSGLSPGTTYNIAVHAVDAAGNQTAAPLTFTQATLAGSTPGFDLSSATYAFKDNNGDPWPSIALTIFVHHVTTGALVATITGYSTNASGIVTTKVTDAALVAGVTYSVNIDGPGGTAYGRIKLAAS